MNNRRYRIGIVGAGFGVQAHLPALRNHPRFEVVAIASPRSAQEVARREEIAAAFSSCAEMVQYVELDAVTIASPPFAHRDDVLAALAARKNVICEKPFAIRLADAQAMAAAAREAGTACGVSHEFRFVPQALALKELIVNGHLDPLRNIEITLLRSSLRRHERRPRGWWFERARGGGLTGAMMSHLVDQLNWLAQRPILRVYGFARQANAQRHDASGTFESEVDDAAFALIEYADALVGRLAADATAAVESYTCAIHGEKRTAVASGPNIIDLSLYTVDAQHTDELQVKASPYAPFSRLGANVPPLMELYDEFVKRIEARPNALPTFGDAVATQEILAKIGYEA